MHHLPYPYSDLIMQEVGAQQFVGKKLSKHGFFGNPVFYFVKFMVASKGNI
jgi:hypothetical protein